MCLRFTRHFNNSNSPSAFWIKIHGFVGWWLWRTYYLANLPTTRKKLKVLADWSSDLIFKPDVSMIKRSDIMGSKIENRLIAPTPVMQDITTST
jgi:hypothetical protein